MARQRVLCTLAACAACFGGLVSTAAACDGAGAPPTRTTVSRAASATLCLINAARAQRGIGRVREVAALDRAAGAHSRDMTARGFFSHDSPGGSTPRQRIARAGYLSGASSWAIGETIAWGSGDLASPAAIVRSWLRSAGHRAILLDERYDDVGIGISLGGPDGDGATFTADFGARK